MGFNPIIDPLPDSFNGCPVNADFKQGLRFFAAMADDSLQEEERSMIGLRLFFPATLPSAQEDAWHFIEHFISGGREADGGQDGPRLFDYNVDAGRLYAAFLQTYGIDLREVKMHWWMFLELFQALPEDTMLLKVVDIRGKRAPKYADAEYKANLQKAKRAFAINKGSNSAAALGKTLMSWAGR